MARLTQVGEYGGQGLERSDEDERLARQRDGLDAGTQKFLGTGDPVTSTVTLEDGPPSPDRWA